jgi:hypothetical protein
VKVKGKSDLVAIYELICDWSGNVLAFSAFPDCYNNNEWNKLSTAEC